MGSDRQQGPTGREGRGGTAGGASALREPLVASSRALGVGDVSEAC